MLQVVVEIFFLFFEFADMLDRTDRHKVKFLKLFFFDDVAMRDRVSLKTLARISGCLGSDIIKLLDLLFESEVSSLQVLNERVLGLHNQDLLV